MAGAEQYSAHSPFEGEGWGEGWLFDSAEPRSPSRFAHAKSDVSDLANVHAEIGNCRFRMAREPTSPTRGEVTGVCRSDDPNFTKPARRQEPGRTCGLAGGAAAVGGFFGPAGLGAAGLGASGVFSAAAPR